MSLLLIQLCGCQYPSKPNTYDSERSREDTEYVYHRVKYAGETLSIITLWYTRSAENLPRIIESNSELNPRKMKLGTLVRIPKDLLKRPVTMPKDFVLSFTNPGAGKESDINLKKKDETNPVGIKEQAKAESAKVEQRAAEKEAKDEYADKSENTASVTTDPASVSNPEGGKPAENPSDSVDKENAKIREQLMQELMK